MDDLRDFHGECWILEDFGTHIYEFGKWVIFQEKNNIV